MPTFRDSWGITRDNIEDFALFRATSKAPRLGGALCPAVEFTFSVATDDDKWRNPTVEERERLAELVKQSGHCCQNEGHQCHLLNQHGREARFGTYDIAEPWKKAGLEAINDWELNDCEGDWWGTYDDGSVDVHIDMEPDEDGTMRPTMTIYPVEWVGNRARTQTDRVLAKATINLYDD